MQIARGITTSEFWITVAQIASVIAAVVAVLVTTDLVNRNPAVAAILVVAGAVANAISTASYANSRGEVKVEAIKQGLTSQNQPEVG